MEPESDKADAWTRPEPIGRGAQLAAFVGLVVATAALGVLTAAFIEIYVKFLRGGGGDPVATLFLIFMIPMLIAGYTAQAAGRKCTKLGVQRKAVGVTVIVTLAVSVVTLLLTW